MSLVLIGVILGLLISLLFFVSLFKEKETDDQKERVNEFIQSNLPKPKKVLKDKYPRKD